MLVTEGVSISDVRRCGIPSLEDYVDDRKYLFLNYLHRLEDAQYERITSFFVRKWFYFAFFGKPGPLNLESTANSDLQQRNRSCGAPTHVEEHIIQTQGIFEPRRDIKIFQEAQEHECQRGRLEEERQELGRQWGRLEQKKQSVERQRKTLTQEVERQEAEKEKQRQEAERQEAERREAENSTAVESMI